MIYTVSNLGILGITPRVEKWEAATPLDAARAFMANYGEAWQKSSDWQRRQTVEVSWDQFPFEERFDFLLCGGISSPGCWIEYGDARRLANTLRHSNGIGRPRGARDLKKRRLRSDKGTKRTQYSIPIPSTSVQS